MWNAPTFFVSSLSLSVECSDVDITATRPPHPPFCFFEDVAFFEYFCTIAVFDLYGEYVVRFPLYLVTTGCFFSKQLMRKFSQSIKVLLIMQVHGILGQRTFIANNESIILHDVWSLSLSFVRWTFKVKDQTCLGPNKKNQAPLNSSVVNS